MVSSGQETSPKRPDRTNQRARTRAALTRAALELIREGRPPSMPGAADRALVSVATAYRYFTTAEELWEEAAVFSVDHLIDEDALERAVEARLGHLPVRHLFVEHQPTDLAHDHLQPSFDVIPRRLDRWFAQQRTGARRATRPGRRNRWNTLAVEPLRGTLTDAQLAALVEALGIGWGTEAMIALYDVLELEPDAAKQRMLTTCRWILHGALADAAARPTRSP